MLIGCVNLNDKCRWLAPDALGGDITNPQSLNRYAYALNNPTTLTDPTGLCGEPDQSYIDSNGVVQVVGSEPCWTEFIGMGLCALTDGYGCGYNTPNVYPTGGGNTGGGGSSTAPAPKPAPPTNTPAVPNSTGCKTGFNFGVTGGADGGLGVDIPPLQAAALGGGSAGLTFGGGTPIGAYASASGGAAAGPWGVPNQGNNLTAVGGGAAAGVGITFGNATSAGQMRGNALTFGVGIDAGVGGGVQVTFGMDAAGHTIWQVNITGGVGYKFYGYSLMTHMVAASTHGGC